MNKDFKIVILGSAGVGKSSICTQFVSGMYLNEYGKKNKKKFWKKKI
jgi:GTPase SAR1 family protein